MAGVQNLVMSLWKVPDAETSAFMQAFYSNMFSKQSVTDAFYNAQASMKSYTGMNRTNGCVGIDAVVVSRRGAEIAQGSKEISINILWFHARTRDGAKTLRISNEDFAPLYF